MKDEFAALVRPQVVPLEDRVYDRCMPDLVSEAIAPKPGTFDVAGMARGEPGLPLAFSWRGTRFEIVELLAHWKHSEREGGGARGELYLRRHYFELRMSDGSIWTVYFIRATPATGDPKKRWFLYTVESGG